MKTKTYDNEKIRAYLLGALAEEEAGQLDELSFIDDEFADELKTAEKDLVDAFVNGELSGARLEQFENYYLASPLRREKVEFARAFQDFAGKKLAEEAKETAAVSETEPKRSFGEILAGFFKLPRLSLQWGFALAALAFMFFGVWLFWENSRLRIEMSRTETNQNEMRQRQTELAEREKQLQNEIANQRSINSETEKELAQIREERAKLEQELKQQQAQQQQRIAEAQRTAAPPNQTQTSPPRQLSIASFILSPSLRGGSQLQTVSIPPNTDFAAMRLELEADDFSVYRVSLNDAAGKNLWRSGALKAKGAGENKSLNVQFPAKLLKSGVYTLTVSGASASGTTENISSYSFRVAPQ